MVPHCPIHAMSVLAATLPSFPAEGPLRVLAMASTGALVGLGAAAIVELRGGRRGGGLWCLGALFAVLLSFLLGRILPALHPISAALVGVLVLRNLWILRGTSRWITLASGLLWLVALLAARRLFAGG